MATIYNTLIYTFLKNIYNFENILEISNYITEIIIKLDPEILYKNLIYLNNYSKLGNYVIYYKKNLKKQIISNNRDEIKKILEICKTPEIDDNEFFSEEERKEVFEIINIESLAFNHFIKTNYKTKKIFSKVSFYECYAQICTTLYNCKIQNTDINVWIPDYNDNLNLSVLRLYYLPNLLYDIILNNNNIYTNTNFSENTKKFVENRYKTEFKILKKYVSLL